jgi:hypothetical protein
MNAAELWSGNHYAHTDNISRGKTFYENANRVRVMRVFKERSYGSERNRTMVEVHMFKDDGSPRVMISGEPMTRTVRARDIFMRWDEYVSERNHRRDKAEEIAQQAAEKEAADEVSKTKLLDALEEKGISRLWINTVDDYKITLRRRDVEEWLGV